MVEASIPEGLADWIYEPLFLDEGPNDTMDTTGTLEGEDTLATNVLLSSPSKSSNEEANLKKMCTSVSIDDDRIGTL